MDTLEFRLVGSSDYITDLLLQLSRWRNDAQLRNTVAETRKLRS